MQNIFTFFWDLINEDLFSAFDFSFSIWDVGVVLFVCTLIGFVIDQLLNLLSNKYY